MLRGWQGLTGPTTIGSYSRGEIPCACVAVAHHSSPQSLTPSPPQWLVAGDDLSYCWLSCVGEATAKEQDTGLPAVAAVDQTTSTVAFSLLPCCLPPLPFPPPPPWRPPFSRVELVQPRPPALLQTSPSAEYSPDRMRSYCATAAAAREKEREHELSCRRRCVLGLVEASEEGESSRERGQGVVL